jgi:CPA1 family monovalent cation:H+ antiporter
MSAKTREHLDTFWELIDEMLNTLLFVLIGLEILVLSYTMSVFVASIIAIPLVLFARSLGVGLPVWLLSFTRTFTPGAYQIMVWGGLRGGISIALALSIPSGAERDLILPVTYAVVVFSILVQGLTVGPLISGIARRNNKS